MRWLSNKRLFQLHGWLGLNLGLLLFLICFSGTCAVFGHELNWLTQPALRVAPPGGPATTLSWDELRRRVERAYPHALVGAVIGAPGDRTAARALVAYTPTDLRWVYVDPFTGEVQGQSLQFDVKSFLRIFHKQFYIVPSAMWPHGTLLVGVFAFVLLFSVVTALLFYKGWWRSLVRLRPRRGRRVFWSDLHRMTGVWALLFSLLFALTGAWYLVERIASTGGVQLTAAATESAPAKLRGRSTTLEPIDLDQAVATAERAYPGLRVSGVRLPIRPGDPMVVRGQAEAGTETSRTDNTPVNSRRIGTGLRWPTRCISGRSAGCSPRPCGSSAGRRSLSASSSGLTSGGCGFDG